MPAGTVIVLQDIEPVPGPVDALPARVCAAINVLSPQPPLTFIARGDEASMLPAIALSQRSSHRTVARYVLVAPTLPAVTESWPDAPVTMVSDDDWLVTQARLRGWDVVAPANLPTLLEDLGQD